MANAEVEIVISPDGGEVVADGKNFVGGVCKGVVDMLTSNLGTTERSAKKPEFYEIIQQRTTVGN